jgi:DNA-binding transcriptional regulator LsrR (DeoR family)
MKDEMIRVANYYYKEKLNQQEIADKMAMSRQRVSRLLKRAEEEGIIEIRIHGYQESCVVVEEKLKDALGLKLVRIVDSEDPGIINEVALDYVENYLFEGCNLGVTFGYTLAQLCKLQRRNEEQNVNVIQMVGGLNTSQNTEFKPDEIVNRLAFILGGRPNCLLIPAIINNVKLKEFIYEEDQFKPMLDKLRNIDVAIMTIGSLTDHPNNVLTRDGYIKQEDQKMLRQKGGIGDICLHFINENGTITDEEFDKRVVGSSVEDIKSIPIRIGISYGLHKVKPIISACRGGFLNFLVTNLSTANEILKKLN